MQHPVAISLSDQEFKKRLQWLMWYDVILPHTLCCGRVIVKWFPSLFYIYIHTHTKQRARGFCFNQFPHEIWVLGSGCWDLILPLTLAFIMWSLHWSLKLQVGVSGIACDTMAKACLLLFVCFVPSTKNWTRHRVVIVKRWIYCKWACNTCQRQEVVPASPGLQLLGFFFTKGKRSSPWKEWI